MKPSSKTSREQALAAARYFGSEYWCNRDTTPKSEYYDDMAVRYGFDTWTNLPADLKKEALAEFDKGIADEKAATRWDGS